MLRMSTRAACRCCETGSHLETRLIRHRNIQHDYIRPQPGGEGQRFGATGRLAHHLKVGLAFDDNV